MPYQRRTYRRRPRYNNYKRLKKGYQSGGLWGLAKKAASGVVKYYLNPEYKFLDNSGSITPTSSGQIISGNSLIGQGDTNSTRDGNSIKITSWLHRHSLEKHASATATRVRLIWFYDISSAGAVPAVLDVLETASTLSPMNKLNGARFKIVKDSHFTLSTDKPLIQTQFYKKMQHHIKYLDTTANTTSLGQGPLYVLAISSEATNTPTLNYSSRMRFLDN